MAEAREQPPARPFLSVFQRGDGRPGELRKWLAASGPTIALLAFIFFLALFVRAYFGYDLAQNNGYLVSGGSDSYYWQHILDYSSKTGKQLFWDPLINWPDGIRNPRPPMYSFSMVIPAVFTQGFFPSLEDAWGAQLLWSTAFWGALTVIPTYLLGKEAFGRRAGLVAAFFLAVMPSHVQRSVISDADHDAFILFFIVLTFYLVLKAVKAQQHKRWVENWRDFASIRKGFKDYFRESKTAILFAAAAGIAYGSVINTWVGFGYVTVLILAYYVIQVLLNKFKNADSMSVTIVIAIVMGVGFLISFPVYYEQQLIPVRFDVPVYLWIASMALGAIFVVSRDYPWTIVLPTVGVILGATIFVINIFNPALAQAVLSGEGYFVQNKLYSTIAEARAPVFSELALSFGMVTFFLSLIGLVWAVWKVPKRIAAAYIFMVVWLVAAIFMAISAGRFMFNASPAFAIAAGWITVLIVDRLDFGSVRKSLSGASGSYWQIFKKSVKVRHMVGALFLGFMVVLPNVWYSVDAGIPQEVKSQYDREIYNDLPSLLRPSGYDKVNGTDWYLGAFGYSIPLERYYYPAAWTWFAEQDNATFPVETRPAYTAWWDYGFEAMQAGKHPTVADNFQNGYQLTGNLIVAQSEDEAIALFAYRLIQASYNEGGARLAQVKGLLEQYGMTGEQWQDIFSGPAQPIIDKVLGDPSVYGPVASDIGAVNARIIYGRVTLVSLGSESLVAFYAQLCQVTGWEIRYFNVDSRMFPSSASNTGIFYAPVKLADRRITGSSTPVDFFKIVGIDENGVQHDIENITSSMTIVQYKVIYQDMFYKSMFYRGMVGYSGTDIGQTSNDGVPGLQNSGTGTLDNYQSMPGWNLTHFRMVYRTAYFNPYPSSQLLGHSLDWKAMNLVDVLSLKTKIDNGEVTGTVDTSAEALYTAGTVFLKYYEGAFVNGTVTTTEGYPVAGVRMTILDEFGIPHGSTFTDAKGHYSLLAPFGNLTLVFSTGDLEGLTQTGATTITTMSFNVTDDQAMRLPTDRDHDGVLDYLITKDYVMAGTELTGDVFWDIDRDGNYTAGTDLLVNGTSLLATETLSGQQFAFNATTGTFDVKLPAGKYDIKARVLGRELPVASGFNVSGTKQETKLAITPSALSGHVSFRDGTDAAGHSIEMLDLVSGVSAVVETDSNGNYSFSRLLAGQYSMITQDPGYVIFNIQANITEGVTLTRNVTIFESSTIVGNIIYGSSQVHYAAWMLVNNYNPQDVISGFTDQFGTVKLTVPKDKWTLYASQATGTDVFANMAFVDTTAGNQTLYLDLRPAAKVSGSVYSPTGNIVTDSYVTFASSTGARMPTMPDSIGRFEILLPEGQYDVTSTASAERGIFSGALSVVRPATSIRVQMSDAVILTGDIHEIRDASIDPSEALRAPYADMEITDSSSRVFTLQAADTGEFTALLPKGSTVRISDADPGYSDWSTTVMISTSTSGYSLTAEPDAVVLAGQLTSGGAGVRGVTITFTPEDPALSTVVASSGAAGAYSVSLPPTRYNVTVDQAANPTGSERYLFSQEQIVTPSSASVPLDVPVTTKVQATGRILGGASNIQITFTGPEVKTLALLQADYSTLLLPGDYDVYATGTVSGRSYANISAISITGASPQNDISLQRAFTVSGMLTLPTGAPLKAITVRATATQGTFVEAKSTTSGRYAVSLPAGTYTLSYLLEDSVSSGVNHVILVEYVGEQSVTVVSSDVSADASLVKRLDNTTFTGKIFGPAGEPLQATVIMVYGGTYGQNLTFTSGADGAFNVSIQPGDYSVYAVRMQDRHAAITTVSFSRNLPRTQNITLSEAVFLSGKVSIAGEGVDLPLKLQSGAVIVNLRSAPDGTFQLLVPSGSYSLTSSTTRVENTVSVTYSSTTAVTVGSSDVFIAQPLQRDTKRGVIASWDSENVPKAGVGDTVSIAVTVINTGNILDHFLVTFTGKDFNVSFTPAEVAVDFGPNSQALVVATISPQSSAAAGEQEVTCLVRSIDFASTRADLKLQVNVSAHRGVKVTNLNTSTVVTSLSTITAFAVNNTGNAQDDIGVEIANLALLQSRGWNAVIIDPATSEQTSSVTVAALGMKALHVRFTQLRSDADPSVNATIFAFSENDTAASAYGDVPIIAPDLAVGKGDITVSRDDVSLVNDAQTRLAIDLGLLIALVALIATFYILRRRKGYGGSSKGGAKK